MIKTGFSTPTTARPIVSKTPSTVHTFQTKARFNNINEKRLVNSVTKPTINTYKTPSKTDTNANINLRKNISRTVDCAKTAIRRSIRRLNSPVYLI
jgi:short-subunit dehydrogenase involved in D-alanine esterification of teichoic acids